jgi:hypothetical protein
VVNIGGPKNGWTMREAHGLRFAGDTLISGDTLRWLADEVGGSVSSIFPAHALRRREPPILRPAR